MDIKTKLKICQWVGVFGLLILVGLMFMRFMFKTSFNGALPLFFIVLAIYTLSVALKNRYLQKL